MLNARAYAWLALLCGLLVTIWFFFKPTADNAQPDESEQNGDGKITSSHHSKLQKQVDTKDSQSALAPAQDELANYGDTTTSVADDIQLVQNLIEVFQYHLKYDDALPTAGNKELTAAMLGDNRYEDRFISTDFEFINDQGEITDRWGSPLIFHFESARCPDIRSIGPDKTPWTEDDVVLPYTFR